MPSADGNELAEPFGVPRKQDEKTTVIISDTSFINKQFALDIFNNIKYSHVDSTSSGAKL